ncbi:MAG: hypothetical protein QF828_03995, partial [Pseudomonadales bacterium]|nr:hypothetical protein [Pseudomonadales bacterium]
MGQHLKSSSVNMKVLWGGLGACHDCLSDCYRPGCHQSLLGAWHDVESGVVAHSLSLMFIFLTAAVANAQWPGQTPPDEVPVYVPADYDPDE